MKQKFFIDFDDTLTLSAKAFCELYNLTYLNHPNFKAANYTLNKKWDFSDTCPLLKPGEIEMFFSTKAFFDILKVHPYCQEILNKWKDKYDYYLVSIGSKNNLKHKLDYLEKNFPMIENIILIENKGVKMDKSMINMKADSGCNVFIDDHQDNLFSSNTDVHIMFKGNCDKEWNIEWNGLTCTNWLEVDKLLEEFIYKYYYSENYLEQLK